LTTRVFTDGLTAHINVGDEAASHELGFQCFGHGGSRRFVRSNGPPSVRVKFEDRATASYGFSGLGGLGSTTGTVTLHICRKSGS
jgi:hypothetical protein